jgi:hypothetical protein
MLGSHNSFTYLPPRIPIFSWFESLWKCHRLSISEQYERGVRFFDLRLVWSWTRKRWEICHGLVRVRGIYFRTAEDIKRYFSKFPGSTYRIVLERKHWNNKEKFIKDFKTAISQDPAIRAIILKRPWYYVYCDSLVSKGMKDYCVRLFGWNVNKSFWTNIKERNFKPNLTIKKWAESHNPSLTQSDIDDKTIIYFMDYVDITS